MPSPAELYKDKIEVSLDGRQIFYLFFGGAVIVGLVFVLGVMVGRRVEARGHVERARTHASTDPLAALDRLEGSGGLSFQDKLIGSAPPPDVEKKIAEIEKARKKAGEPAKKLDEVKPAEPKAVEKKPADEKVEAAAEPKPEKKAEKKDSAKSDKQDSEKVAEEKPPEKQRWTLQLSSFQDRAEAESFLASVKSSGYQPTLTEAKVDGKTYYRVRLGTYKSIENANNAKSDYEKSSKKSASIMKL